MNLRNFLCIFLLQNLHLSYTERQQSFVAHIWKQLQEEDPLKLCFFDANFVVCLLDFFMFLKIENVSNFLIKNALTMNHLQSPVFLRKKPLSWNDVKKKRKKKKKNEKLSWREKQALYFQLCYLQLKSYVRFYLIQG